MGADWINIHTHRPGAGINIVDTCLGEVVRDVDGVIYFSEGIHPMYIGEGTEQRLAEIGQAAAAGKIVAVGFGQKFSRSDGGTAHVVRTAGCNCRTIRFTFDYSRCAGDSRIDYRV